MGAGSLKTGQGLVKSRQRHSEAASFGAWGANQRIAVAEKLLKSKIYIISSSVGLNSKERMWWLYLKTSLTEGRRLKEEDLL